MLSLLLYELLKFVLKCVILVIIIIFFLLFLIIIWDVLISHETDINSLKENKEEDDDKDEHN